MPTGLPSTLEQARLQARFRAFYAFQQVFYPEDSGLVATDVQAALTELKTLVDAGGGGVTLLDGGDASNDTAATNFGINCGGAD
jgi:hypothetical protein